VYKGRLGTNERSDAVAIKTHISKVGVQEFKALLSEVKILAHVGKHPHVVSFLGACTENIRKRECLIVRILFFVGLR
jgi:FMS-like tyrosine kinase 1